MPDPSLPSLADRVRPIAVDGTIVGVHFLEGRPVFVLGEEALLFAGEDEKRVAIHAGAILASVCDGKRLVTGGDDGNLVSIDSTGAFRVLATDDKKRWIDQRRARAGRRGRLVGRQGRARAYRQRRGA